MTIKSEFEAAQAAQFFDVDQHAAESATYYGPGEDFTTATGTAVVAVVTDKGRPAEFGEAREELARHGEALLPKATITLSNGRPDLWGWLRDAAGNLWTVTDLVAENGALYKVRLRRTDVRQFGSVRAGR